MATNTFDQYTSNGSLAAYSYTFDLLGSFSSVVVKVRLTADTTFITKAVDTDYTLDKDAAQITFITGFVPPLNAIIRIERSTVRERQVDYVSGSTLTERTMDNDTNRLTSVDQEIQSDLSRAMLKTDDNSFWEGEGLPSIRCGQAQHPDGWTTKSQVESMLLGVVGIDATGATVYVFQADGIETLYELSGLQGATRQVVDVYVEQVYQSSDGNTFSILNKNDSDFPSAGDIDDYLEFAVAPPDGAEIEVKVLTGQVLAEIEDGSITTAMLQDDAVTTSKMTMGSGVATRVFVGDTAGDPVARQLTPADILGTGTAATALLTAIKAGISIDQLVKAAANVDMNGFKVVNGSCVEADVDGVLATKLYVDSEISDLSAALGVLDFKFQVFVETDFSSWPGAGFGSYDIPLSFRPDLVFPYFKMSDAVLNFAEPAAYGIDVLNDGENYNINAHRFYSRWRADFNNTDVATGSPPFAGGYTGTRMGIGWNRSSIGVWTGPMAWIETGSSSGDHYLRFTKARTGFNGYDHFTALCLKFTGS